MTSNQPAPAGKVSLCAFRGGIVMLAATACMLAASAASASPVVIDALQAPDVENRFSLTFDQAHGGTRGSEIASTQFGMQLDFVTATAQFTGYSQRIPSIDLPDGTGAGVIPTGEITVSIIPGIIGEPGSEVGSLTELSAGLYEFSTTDTYLVSFENDLTMFGLPADGVVPLQSTSVGEIAVDEMGDGTLSGSITLDWNGGGALINPQTIGLPQEMWEFLDFSYSCRTESNFEAVPEPASAALLAIGAAAMLRRRFPR